MSTNLLPDRTFYSFCSKIYWNLIFTARSLESVVCSFIQSNKSNFRFDADALFLIQMFTIQYPSQGYYTIQRVITEGLLFISLYLRDLRKAETRRKCFWLCSFWQEFWDYFGLIQWSGFCLVDIPRQSIIILFHLKISWFLLVARPLMYLVPPVPGIPLITRCKPVQFITDTETQILHWKPTYWASAKRIWKDFSSNYFPIS